jgi:hypothetical protein
MNEPPFVRVHVKVMCGTFEYSNPNNLFIWYSTQNPDLTILDAHQSEKIQARNITLPTSGALEDNLA